MDQNVKEVVQSIVNNYFPEATKYIADICEKLADTNVLNMVEVYYKISHFVVTHCNESKIDINKFLLYFTKQTNCNISPYAKLKNIKCNGVNTYIDGCVTADDGLIVGNHVIIGKCQNNDYIDKISVVIGKNCNIGNNVRIYPNVTIGDNVIIEDNCIIKENVPNNVVVSIVNQLQLKHSTLASVVPSQTLMVYGVVPKFKNTFVIHGEGFYNPKVIVKLKSGKTLDYEVSYWDKNKIIVKVKETKPISDDSLVVVMSNGNKITLINNFGVFRTLKSLN